MRDQQIRAYYDGHCGLCHRAVVFLVKRDRPGKLRFTPIQSERYQLFAKEHRITLTPRSILVWSPESNQLLSEAEAVLFLLRTIGAWPFAIQFAAWFPKALLNNTYRLVARLRHRCFRRPTQLAPPLPPQFSDRIEL